MVMMLQLQIHDAAMNAARGVGKHGRGLSLPADAPRRITARRIFIFPASIFHVPFSILNFSSYLCTEKKEP